MMGRPRQVRSGRGREFSLAPMIVLALILASIQAIYASTQDLPRLERIRNYELVQPVRSTSTASRGTAESDDYFNSNTDAQSFRFQAFNEDFEVVLLSNADLFAPDYRELIVSPEGEVLSTRRDVDTSCFFTGHVVGDPDSKVVVVTCGREQRPGEIAGRIQAHGLQLQLEPRSWHPQLDALASAAAGSDSADQPNVVVFRDEDYDDADLPKGCGVGHTEDGLDHEHSDNEQQQHADSDAATPRQHGEMNLMADKRLDIIIVNDYLRFQQRGSATHSQTANIMSLVAGLYDLPGTAWDHQIRVRLTHQITFALGDPYPTPGPLGTGVDYAELLSIFNAWVIGARNSGAIPGFDLAHLFSGYTFGNSVIGYAFIGTVCSASTPTGINQVTTNSASYAAKLVAHEMGHNFGSRHDNEISISHGLTSSYVADNCNIANRFIMYPSISSTADLTWSPCSKIWIDYFLSFSRTCLDTFAHNPWANSPVCGDGLREGAEQCDCGQLDCSGSDPCCDGATCRLKTSASCSSQWDSCCTSTCSFRPSSDVCRPAVGSCDWEETCTGTSAGCPEDTFRNTGESCSDTIPLTPTFLGSCHAGHCLNHQAQCLDAATRVSSSIDGECAHRGDDSANAGCGDLYCKNKDMPSACLGKWVFGGVPLLVEDGTPCSPNQVCDGTSCVMTTAMSTPRYTFGWVPGAWSICSKTCGGGIHTRTITCGAYLGSTLVRSVPDSECPPGSKPLASETCNTHDCYHWHSQPLAGCSESCAGTQPMDVICRHTQSNMVAPDAECELTGDKPPSTALCNMEACAWKKTLVGGCSKFCNSGTQSLSLSCRLKSGGSLLDNSRCSHLTQPPTSEPCNIQECRWLTGSWSECSVECDSGLEGVRNRPVQCEDSTGTLVDSSPDCPSGSRPAHEETCTGCSSSSSDSTTIGISAGVGGAVALLAALLLLWCFCCRGSNKRKQKVADQASVLPTMAAPTLPPKRGAGPGVQNSQWQPQKQVEGIQLDTY